MTIEIQITCVSKNDNQNPHERIRSIGGLNIDGSRWKISQDGAIEGIKAGKWKFSTTGGGKLERVVIAVHNGREYLKTESDGVHPDNLLALPECP